jgi:putative phosphoesterase
MALIGLISDVHASPEPVAQAMSIFADAGVEQVYCAGDIAGYMDQLEQTIELLQQYNCLSVMGNHDLSYLEKHQQVRSDAVEYLQQLPMYMETAIEGKSVYMVHAQPPDEYHGGIKLLDQNAVLMPARLAYWEQMLQSFDHDVLIVGHTHQVFAERIGDTLVVNPGSSVFNHCCAILRLPEMSVQTFSLSGKNIEKTWNWAQHVIYAKK